jgi:SAM-dependent methyltransferase
MSMSNRDYVLGTHDAEIERLGLQHRVWRGIATQAWRRAGITIGSHVLDIGAGPGYASIDLAECVGPSGSVLAIERSTRFANYARAIAEARGLTQLVVREADLLEADLGDAVVDASWSRWVLSFVSNPTLVVSKLRRALKPGGVAIFHEYVDYRAWRLAPGSAAHEHFVGQVMKSWRADGGEPDIGLVLPAMLSGAGFQIESLTLRQEIARPGDYFWAWPKAFVETGTDRLVALGYLSQTEANAAKQATRDVEALPSGFVLTPTVLEILARVPK